MPQQFRFTEILQRTLIIAMILALPIGLTAQIQVVSGSQNPWTPESLITQSLLGDGIVINSVLFNGAPTATGYFNTGSMDIGMDRGVILSTGNVASNTLNPVNAPASDLSGTTTSGMLSDPDLENIVGTSVQDMGRYIIDFTPLGDTMYLKFVFASEEYPENSCEMFDDVLGIFLTDAGGNTENLATLPDGTEISVTRVHGGYDPNGCAPVNGGFYNDNQSSPNLVYDGYLDVIEIKKKVTKCANYTLKIAIADQGADPGTGQADFARDSGVFLEEGSFRSTVPTSEPISLTSTRVLYEGCEGAEIEVELPEDAVSTTTISIGFGGTAVEGTDFTASANEIVIDAGDNSGSISLSALKDADDTEGDESFYVTLDLYGCGVRDTIHLQVREDPIQQPMLQEDPTICLGDSVQMEPQLMPPSNMATTFEATAANPQDASDIGPGPAAVASVVVSGIVPDFLGPGVINSVCLTLNYFSARDLVVYLRAPNGRILELSSHNGGSDNGYNVCFVDDVLAPPIAPVGELRPGNPAGTAITGIFQPEGQWETLWEDLAPTNGTWDLIVYDVVNGGSIPPVPIEFSISFNPPSIYQYQWTPTTGLSCSNCPQPYAKPTVDTEYVLRVSDNNGCSKTDTVTVNVIDSLRIPNAVCSSATSNDLRVLWDEAPGATGYQIQVDGGAFIGPNNGLRDHLVTGLDPGQVLDITLRPQGSCVPKDTSFQCEVQACDPPELTLVGFDEPSCNGGSDGTLTVSATSNSGATSFIYVISDPFQSSNIGNFTGLAAGDYEVIVQDDFGCFDTLDVSLSQPTSISTTTNVIRNPSCVGFSNALGSVTAMNGTPNYTYSWSNGSALANITMAPAGEFFVTVTDDNGCTAVDTIEFVDPPAIGLSFMSNDVSCNGAMDGSATVAVTNATEPIDYQWEPSAGNQTTATASNLSGGTFRVVINDDNNCTASETVTIAENTAITTTISGTDATCDGIDDGIAEVSGTTGGAGGYSYLWNDAMATIGERTDIAAVGYAVVTITDNDGCMVADSVLIESPPAMTSNVSTVPVSCSGAADGEATITVMGGAGDYEYAWSDGGATTNNRTDLLAGTNVVTVTDANGCRLIRDVEINSQNPIQLAMDSTIVTCNAGSDGTASVTASGGVGMLSYEWSTGSTATSITGLTAGEYKVTVSDDNGCFVDGSIEVTENIAIELSVMTTDLLCFGDTDGSATVSVDNGITPDAFLWNDLSAQTNATAASLGAGLYEVVVTYNGTCEGTAEAVINQPMALEIMIDKSDIACSGETNGSATANVTGGTGLYDYQWSDGSIMQTASDLVANMYTVSVTDANMCMMTEDVEIIEPAALVIVDNTSSGVNCFNEANGQALVTPGGGTIPYTYTWSDGLSSDSLRNDLLPQMYTVTVTDNSNCSVTADYNIPNRPQILLDGDSTRVTCFGGSDGTAEVLSSGGAGGFMFVWNDAGSTTNAIATGLSAGTYMVTVTDALGCPETLDVEVTENDEIEITGEVVDVRCYDENNGRAEALAIGGVGNLSFLWDDPTMATISDVQNLTAGTYTVFVTDDLGCIDSLDFVVQEPDSIQIAFSIDGILCFGDEIGSIQSTVTGGNGGFDYAWSNGDMTSDIADLPQGMYSLTVTDDLGCSNTDGVELITPPLLTVTLDSTDVLCNGASTGAINSSVNGGTPGYSYSYTGGITAANPVNLSAGKYVLTLTDNNGCEVMDSIVINEPTAIEIAETVEDIACFGDLTGEIDLTVMGGVEPYDYAWSNGQQVADITGLSLGDYTVTVTDDNNCATPKTIEIESPPELQIALSKNDVLCFGESTGQVGISVSGGSGAINFEWSDGSTSPTLSDVASGRYALTVTDENGCVDSDSTEVLQPSAPLSATPMTSDLVCSGDANGVIDLDVMGGTEPYQYRLNGGAISNNPTFLGLAGGMYEVDIIDNNGCVTSVEDIDLFEPPPFVVDLGDNVIVELGDNDYQLIPSITGGQGGLTYTWSGESLENLTCTDCADPFIFGQVYTKDYTLTVSDDQGCTAVDNIRVIISKDRRVWVPTAFTPNADNNNDMLAPMGDPNTLVHSFKLYDRWGTLVFEASDFQIGQLSVGWDGMLNGEPMDPGVFVWKAEVRFFEDGLEATFAGQTFLLK